MDLLSGSYPYHIPCPLPVGNQAVCLVFKSINIFLRHNKGERTGTAEHVRGYGHTDDISYMYRQLFKVILELRVP